MKVLFFSSYYYPYLSGITTYPYTLFSHLSKKHDITVLTFPHATNLHTEVGNPRIVRLPYLFKISKGYISPQSVWHFYKHTIKNDIVILNIPNFEGILLAIIAKLLRKKIVSIFHCEVILGNTLLEKIISSILNISVYFQLLLSDVIVGYTSDYVTSRKLSNIFLHKFRFIYPPVSPLKATTRLPVGLKQKNKSKIYLGYAGRIAREKGITYLVKAAEILTYNKIKAELVFAGPYGKQVAGEENYYGEVMSLLKNSNIPFKFLGSLREEELSAFYAYIDILVLPSINQTEAFGQVQVDAMLLGTPVISTDLPGVRVPIQETKMGKIVRKQDAMQLAQAIQEVYTNKSKFSNAQLVENAHKIFDIHTTYTFYENLLNTLNYDKK